MILPQHSGGLCAEVQLASSSDWIYRMDSLPARSVHRRESPFKGFPTWRYRVLKTALRLRPRRALSSASGQRNILARGAPERKYLNFELYQLTNHIPVHSRLRF